MGRGREPVGRAGRRSATHGLLRPGRLGLGAGEQEELSPHPAVRDGDPALAGPKRAGSARHRDARRSEQGARGDPLPTAESGLFRYDQYDARSLIENRLNREGKQHFGLGTSLARNEAAMRSATVFSTLALMLHRGWSCTKHERRKRTINAPRRWGASLSTTADAHPSRNGRRGHGEQYGRIPLLELLQHLGPNWDPRAALRNDVKRSARSKRPRIEADGRPP